MARDNIERDRRTLQAAIQVLRAARSMSPHRCDDAIKAIEAAMAAPIRKLRA